MDLTGTVITVKFRLDDSVSVRSDATAAVRLITPIGGRVLDLDPGSGPTALSGPSPCSDIEYLRHLQHARDDDAGVP